MDNRALLSYVAEREFVIDYMLNQLERSGNSHIRGVAGTATAGIPWAAWLASRLQLPMLYVRGDSKKWGLERSVEGQRDDIDRVVLVEDLVFTGGSTLNAVANLRKAGMHVDIAMCIVTYNLYSTAQALQEEAVRLNSLTDVEEVIQVAKKRELISDYDTAAVRAWLAETRRN
ncbi:MAG: orotate phosphoribosyltransferase [Pseudonocardiaceae bacterium]